MKLLAVDEARARMLGGVAPGPAETVPLQQALGRVLAKDVIAPRDQPPFASSAMDGWAVRGADALQADVTLEIVGESAAGRGFQGRIGPGQAARIFTGAPLPDGADTVVIQEEAERSGDKVRLGPLAAAVANVRPRGGDFRQGETLLRAGQRLDA